MCDLQRTDQRSAVVGFSLTFLLCRKSSQVTPTRSSSALPLPSVRKSQTPARPSSWSSPSCAKVSMQVISLILTFTLAPASYIVSTFMPTRVNWIPLNLSRQGCDLLTLAETVSCLGPYSFLLCFLSGQHVCVITANFTLAIPAGFKGYLNQFKQYSLPVNSDNFFP